MMAPSVELRNDWSKRFLILCGGFLVASGVGHVIIWCFSGESLAGPVSLRKPILFGLSAGVTLISLGWLLSKLKALPGDRVLAVICGLAMIVEVMLIDLQYWRGVPSHFNRETAIDATIHGGITALITIVTAGIIYLTARSFGAISASPEMKLGIRVGMVLLTLSCLLGFAVSFYGDYQIRHGEDPHTFGTAGVMKFPHGVPMHAIQFLPCFVWLAAKIQRSTRLRFHATFWCSIAIVIFTVFSCVQTLQGRARFDLSIGTASILAFSAIAAMLSFWALLRSGK